MRCSKWNDVDARRKDVEIFRGLSPRSCMYGDFSNSVLSLTGSFFICKSTAEEICCFRRVLGFSSMCVDLWSPALKSSIAPKRWVREETGNAYLFTFKRICFLSKLSENITCFLTSSSSACE